MTEPAGVEPALQVLTAKQRGFLSGGMVPEPTEQQAEEMRVFSELHGPASGADFAWTYAARLLIDHFELARMRVTARAYVVQPGDTLIVEMPEGFTMELAHQTAEQLREYLPAGARLQLIRAGVVVAVHQPWWRRALDRLRAVRS